MANYDTQTYRQQILEKPGSSSTSFWPWRLVIFSIATFIFSLALYAGLAFGYTDYLEGQIDFKRTSLNELTKIVPKADQEEFLQFYLQLLSLKQILNNHVAGSRIFDWIEENTNRKVFYSGITVNMLANTARIEGVSESYDVLAEQLNAYQEAPFVESVILSQANQKEDDRVSFGLLITFERDFFIFKSS